MIKQILGFLGSTSIAILITAAGLVIGARELTYFGGALLALVASAWLLLRFNPRPDAGEIAEARKSRRELILSTRDFVARFTQTPHGREFRDAFEKTTMFPRLRRHLSAEFMADFNNRRLSASTNSSMDTFAKRLLDEIDRLETEWKLDDPR